MLKETYDVGDVNLVKFKFIFKKPNPNKITERTSKKFLTTRR